MKPLILILIVASLLIAGCGDDKKSSPVSSLTSSLTVKPTPSPTSTGEPDAITVSPTETEGSKLPVDTIYAYIEAINAENLDNMIECFIEGTYDEKVIAAVEKKFDQGTAQILNAETVLVSQSEFLATYEVSYDATWQAGDEPVNTSQVKDEVRLVKIEGKWLIEKIKELERARIIDFSTLTFGE